MIPYRRRVSPALKRDVPVCPAFLPVPLARSCAWKLIHRGPLGVTDRAAPNRARRSYGVGMSVT